MSNAFVADFGLWFWRAGRLFLPAELAGCAAELAAEAGGEVALVRVAAGGGHELDGQAGGREQAAGMLQARLLQPGKRPLPGGGEKESTRSCRRSRTPI